MKVEIVEILEDNDGNRSQANMKNSRKENR
jgi:hypothetical protein